MHHLSSRYIPCDGRLTASAYFDPRSPHRERHLTRTIEAGISYISIHAPRRGSDLRGAVPFHPDGYFNPRSPYENAYFSPIVSMCATTSRTKKSENQSFIRIISRLGTYVFHLRLVSIPQIIEPYAVRLLVHQHFQCGTK